MDTVKYTVVIPIYNEEEGLPELYRRISIVLNQVTGEYEIIFVSDGSTDNSINILKTMSREDRRVKVIELSRNFGHQVAITAGLTFSRGNAVIVMDGDLQDPPEMIPRFIKEWDKGFEVVYAIRNSRKESIIKKTAYKYFYRICRFLANIEIPLDTGDFCLMDRKIVDILNAMPERNRFIRGLRSWVGYRQGHIGYDRGERYAGEPKYTAAKLIKLALDGIFSFSHKPLRFVSIFGLMVSILGFFGIVFVLCLRLFTSTTVPGTTTVIICVLFIGGVQLIATGIGGEYIGRVYDEVKMRPQFIISRKIGFDEEILI